MQELEEKTLAHAGTQLAKINGTLHKAPSHIPILSTVYTYSQQGNGQGNGYNDQRHDTSIAGKRTC
jgi:hypothetical protein